MKIVRLQPIVKPHVSSETWGLAYRMIPLHESEKRTRKWLPEQESHFLHVLNGGGEECLLAHVGVAAHARITKSVELFGIRERKFNRLFSPSVEALSRRSFCEGIRLIQIVLPNMSRHHLSFTACSETFSPFWTGLTSFCVAAILTVSFTACRGVLEQTTFRANIAIERRIVVKSEFTVSSVRVRVPSIP